MGQSTRRLIMGAAGAVGGSTFVDDIFSTFLYRGTGVARAIDNGLKIGNANAGNSVNFGGLGDASDYLQMAHTTDLCFGNGDFTIECWAYAAKHDSWNGIFGNWTGSGDNGYVLETVNGDLEFYYYNDSNTFVGPVQGGAVSVGQWSHLCVCRSGSTIRVFVNGTMYGSGTSITTGIRDGTSNFTIGGQVAGGGWWDGNITNLRVTKGQALYTANFTPSTAPFTTTSQGATESNVKLLCCNKDTVTGSTVTPGTITAFGSPTASNSGTGTASDGKGGLVWIKHRDSSYGHGLYDTERGATKMLESSSINAQTTEPNQLTAFLNNGFQIDSNSQVNQNNNDFVSWSFCKAPGFFDVISWVGNSTANREITHELGCVPGMIIIKNVTDQEHWYVYHRGVDSIEPWDYHLRLDGNYSRTDWDGMLMDTAPTSSSFKIGDGGGVNQNGKTYICYLFASEDTSTAATARSVYYPAASGNGVRTNASNDFNVGTSDFTLEGYFYYENVTSGYQVLFDQRASSSTEISLIAGKQPDGKVYIENGPDGYGGTMILRTAQPEITEVNKWYHIAFSRHSGTLKLFINGVEKGSVSTSVNFGGNNWQIGNAHQQSGNYAVQGYMSNIRFIKGQGIYTSAFTPSTEPLTTTSQGATASNVKLLCFQNTTVNGHTVNASGGWASNHGTPLVSTFSPFLDAASPSNTFGEGGDQNIIKCGNYTGNGSNDGPEVYLGWEPQWLLIKNATTSNREWKMLDVIRGVPTGTGDVTINADTTEAENTGQDVVDVTPTGFKITNNNAHYNENGERIIYIAIRRPDGYVGKPAVVGTDVFAMDAGNGSATIPAYDSGFPVDFALDRRPAASEDWYTSARLIGAKYLRTNTTTAETSGASYLWDSNVGYVAGNWADSSYQSWMWKRHAGFDVVNYSGQSGSKTVPHSLNAVPEMMWVKNRTYDDANGWTVYHKGLNGGTNPEQYRMRLQSTTGEDDNNLAWNDTAPTSTHFTLGTDRMVNQGSYNYIAMLFASVDGISKVGYYTGNGSTQTITTGFSPRFAIIRRTDGSEDHWLVLDTTRGWVSGNDKGLKLNSNSAQGTSEDYGVPTSTGFTLTSNGWVNYNTGKFIYYAHA